MNCLTYWEIHILVMSLVRFVLPLHLSVITITRLQAATSYLSLLCKQGERLA